MDFGAQRAAGAKSPRQTELKTKGDIKQRIIRLEAKRICIISGLHFGSVKKKVFCLLELTKGGNEFNRRFDFKPTALTASFFVNRATQITRNPQKIREDYSFPNSPFLKRKRDDKLLTFVKAGMVSNRNRIDEM
ncbi:hypothetical protein [Abditibacterium utsteinense]|uniref:hypothetical protein n=1 Tax=Abditibacterium utsteinense TaxID=1960156 RepID=UPI001300181E|nr:hypothetical protein [Abditibacterium utsteinense]